MFRQLILILLVVGSTGWLAVVPGRHNKGLWSPQTRSKRSQSTTTGDDALRTVSSSPDFDLALSGGVNGDHHQLEKLAEVSDDVGADQRLPEAPPLSYQKFLTMQEKRASVEIRYSGDAGLKPYFLTVAKKLKASHPDVIIERRILPKINVETDEPTFEIVIDGKVVLGNGKGRPRKAKISRLDMQKGRSVFVSMAELDIAICRARRKLRPTTVYGDPAEAA